MNIDLSPVVQALVALAAAAIPILATKAWTWLSSQIHSNDVSLVSNAVQRVAGEVVEQLVAMPETPQLTAALDEVKERLVQQGVEALMRVRIPDTVQKLGVTPSTLAGMVRGELGKLVASGLQGEPLK